MSRLQEKMKYLKPLFTSDEERLQYEKSIILDTCYDLKINPIEWIRKADDTLYLELGSLLFRMTRSEENYFIVLQGLYDKNKRLPRFKNKDSEIGHHQAVVMSYCLHHNLRLTDLKAVEEIDHKNEHHKYEFDNIHRSIELLEEKKAPLIKKSWENDLLSFLKAVGY